jgi:hypothetical protein
MQLPPGRSKRCTQIFNYEGIDKTATFSLTPSGVTSDLYAHSQLRLEQAKLAIA